LQGRVSLPLLARAPDEGLVFAVASPAVAVGFGDGACHSLVAVVPLDPVALALIQTSRNLRRHQLRNLPEGERPVVVAGYDPAKTLRSHTPLP